MAQLLKSVSVPGSAIYGITVILGVYALGSRDWSSLDDTGVTVDGYSTKVLFSMGLFDYKGQVIQEGQLQYQADGYQWCAGADPGPIFDVHQKALCGFLKGARAAGSVSLLLAMVAVTLCLLLSIDTFKKRYRRDVSVATAVLAFLQFFFTTSCIVLWCCLFKVMNADLKAQYPGLGLKLSLGPAWAMMLMATFVCLGAAIGIAAHSKGEVVIRRGPMEMGPRPDLEAAKQQTGWWIQAAAAQQGEEEAKHNVSQ